MCSKLKMKTRSRLGTDSNHSTSPPHKRKTSRRKESVSVFATASASDTAHKGKETKNRTPKLSRKREIKATTPGSGSAREDLLCSQHFDSQTVVGWDCNSPAAVRNLSSRKHVVGLEDDGVEDLVLQLIGDQPQEDASRSGNTPPLLGLWRDKPKDQCDIFGKAPGHYRNRLRKRHGRQRKHSGVSLVSHEVLDKLTAVLNNCSDVDKETEGRNAESELCLPDVAELAESSEESESVITHNTSNDLFESFKHDSAVTNKPEITGLSKADNKNLETEKYNLKKPTEICDDLADTTWSDDELFGDDSFIVHATQVPQTRNSKHSSPFIGKRKLSDRGLPKSKATKYSFSIGNEGEVTKTNISIIKPAIYTAITSKSSNINQQSCTKSDKKNQNLSSKPPISGIRSSHSAGVSGCANVTRNVSKSATDLNKNVICSTRGQLDNISQPRNNTIQSGQSSAFTSCTTMSTSSSTLNNQSLNRSGSFKKYNSFSGQNIPNNVPISGRQRSLSGSGQGQMNTSKLYSNTSATSVSHTNQNFNTSYRNDSSKTSSTTSQRPVQKSTNLTKTSNFNYNSDQSVYKKNNDNSNATTTNRQGNISVFMNTSSVLTNTKTFSTYVPSNIRKGVAQTSNNRSADIAKYSKDNRASHPAVTSLSKPQTDKLDTSLSDDILCQLAEPDEILDSQMDPCTASHRLGANMNPSSISSVQHKSTQENKIRSDMITQRIVGPVQHNMSNSKTVQENAFKDDINKQNSAKKKFSFKPSQKPGTLHGMKDAKSNDNKSVKETIQVSDLCKIQGTKETPFSNKSTALNSKPSQKFIPVDQQAKTTGYDNPYSEDLFSDDDDLLADSEGLTESEIFAMLDEAELMATQRLAETTQLQKTVTDSTSVKTERVNNTNTMVKQNDEKTKTDVKLEPQNTEKRDSLNGSQGQPSSQGQPLSQGQPSSQGHSSSQGQLSSSQAKYSADEIERKKQLALERRQKRLKESQAQKK